MAADNLTGKVSMVMPCYNKAEYIGAMLQSIINQKWDNIELIMVNDGSTDGTREIISQWEPKLYARGYEVIIIDQANQGVCAAVYNGMLRMTGDYFCLVDADDELFPEYVSRMAGWLDENEDYEWASCSYQRAVWDDGKRVLEPPCRPDVPQDTPNTLENWLLWRTIAMTWIYMIRMSYVKKCGLIEHFCTERRATYEPCVVIPPAVAGGKMKFFNEPLYLYNKYASGMSDFTEFEKVLEYYTDYLYLSERMIERLDIPKKNYYVFLARLIYKFRFVVYQSVPNIEKYQAGLVEDILSMLDGVLVPTPRIGQEEVFSAGVLTFFEAVRCIILKLDKELIEDCKKAHRIIGYGALGKRGRRYMPRFAGSPICPSVLWDKSAGDYEELGGISVTPPDFESLTPDDAIIVFPNNSPALDELYAILKQKGVKQILYGQALNRTLSILAFPSLWNCEVLTASFE